MKDLWDKSYKCPVCGQEFKSKKVRIDSIKVESYDGDLKPNYSGINPLYYEIIVCPNCFYADYEINFEKEIKFNEIDIIKETLKKIKEKLADKDYSFTNERDIEVALRAYGIVIALANALKKPCKLADAYLKAAWLLREKNEELEENIALAHALKNFEECYLTSDIPSGKGEEKILFYLGELNRYFGRKDEAIKWFSILMDKYRNSSSYYAKVGKERWQNMRG